ncbi:MAG: YciI family protein [Sulfurospirillaceae bacterium]|nr:YciI family protein [Sulfurospirillaceae bacterium]
MFIVSLTYVQPLEKIDKYLTEHVNYLTEQYKAGNFIASGRKIPRTGGIILSKMDSLEELKAVLKKDPFNRENLATYDIQEFIPSMTSSEFENLKE